jgi:hypothetical protein
MSKRLAILTLPIVLAFAGCSNRQESQPADSTTTRATRGASEMVADAWNVTSAKVEQVAKDPKTYDSIKNATATTLEAGENTVKAIGSGIKQYWAERQARNQPPVVQQQALTMYPDSNP